MKAIIIIGLVIVFNDFFGSLIVYIGTLTIKLGNLITSIPTLF